MWTKMIGMCYIFNMKKKIVILAGIIALISAAVFANESLMKVDTNECSVSVPENWGAMYSSQIVKGNLLLCLMAPLKEGESFQSNLNVVVTKITKKISEKEALEVGAKELKMIFPNFKLLEQGKNYHIYTATMYGQNVKQVQFIKIHGKKSYVFTGTSSIDAFDSHYDDFKNIFESFNLKTSASSPDFLTLGVSNCSLKIPCEWYAQFTNTDNIIYLYTPLNKDSGVRGSLSLEKVTLQDKYSEKEYLELLQSNFSETIDAFSLVEQGKNFHVYTAINSDGMAIKEVQYLKSNDQKTYFVLTCTATPNDFDKYADSFSDIAKSLVIK